MTIRRNHNPDATRAARQLGFIQQDIPTRTVLICLDETHTRPDALDATVTRAERYVFDNGSWRMTLYTAPGAETVLAYDDHAVRLWDDARVPLEQIDHLPAIFR